MTQSIELANNTHLHNAIHDSLIVLVEHVFAAQISGDEQLATATIVIFPDELPDEISPSSILNLDLSAEVIDEQIRIVQFADPTVGADVQKPDRRRISAVNPVLLTTERESIEQSLQQMRLSASASTSKKQTTISVDSFRYSPDCHVEVFARNLLVESLLLKKSTNHIRRDW